MLQPFEVFKINYIPQLIKLKKIYLVTQTYKRAHNLFTEAGKIDLLISTYDDAAKAKIHYNAVKQDKYSAVINLTKEIHLQKLQEMLGEGSTYRLYWAIVKDASKLEKNIDKLYKEHFKRYIDKHTNWRLGSNTLKPDIQLIFGELFVILKYAGQTLRIKFEEIEKS